MIPFLILLAWILFSALEGIREAYYFSVKSEGTKFKSFDEHPMFAAQRLLVISIFSVSCASGWLSWLAFCVSFSLIFPMIHDGIYYETRRRLDKIYKRGFLDHSKTSTAVMTRFLIFPVRLIMFITGTVLFLISLYVIR